MKKVFSILGIVLVLLITFECDKKKPNNPELEDPSYYFPINFNYKWTYVLLWTGCVPGEVSYTLTAANKSSRSEWSGWDMVSSSGDTGFVYRRGDTIFYKSNVQQNQPSHKVLVGPIKVGTNWKDDLGFEYYIVGFEDLPSSVAGITYKGCVKIRRTTSGDVNTNYYWWAPQYGKVKWAKVNPNGDCLEGDELKRLDKIPDFP